MPLDVQFQVCYLPPPGATASARIAVTLGPGGEVQDAVIASSGDGAANQALAAAGLRAVRRCAPFRVNGVTQIMLTFQPNEDEPAAAPDQARGAPGSD
jgi:hypothetical protein